MVVNLSFPAENGSPSQVVALDHLSPTGSRGFVVNDVFTIVVGPEQRKYRIASVRLGKAKNIGLERVIEPPAAVAPKLKSGLIDWFTRG